MFSSTSAATAADIDDCRAAVRTHHHCACPPRHRATAPPPALQSNFDDKIVFQNPQPNPFSASSSWGLSSSISSSFQQPHPHSPHNTPFSPPPLSSQHLEPRYQAEHLEKYLLLKTPICSLDELSTVGATTLSSFFKKSVKLTRVVASCVPRPYFIPSSSALGPIWHRRRIQDLQSGQECPTARLVRRDESIAFTDPAFPRFCACIFPARL